CGCSAGGAVEGCGDGDSWSKDDCLMLLERIRTFLPEGDTMKYKTTESHFDWDKVGFGSFTGDMCKQKWQKVSSEVRKYRTMTELIVDAIEFVKNPYKGKKLKTHPDFPKKPLTPYFRFFMEKRAKYAKIHPEMSNLDLTKILSKKYKELPDKKKMKYIQEFQREKESFEKNMARFKEDHPELIEERKKSDLPEKPKTPQQLWYNHEKKTYMKLHPDVSQKELKEALRRQWSQLSDKKRLKWISKALELQKDYEESMRAYHEAHPDASSDEHTKSVLTKAERQLKDKFDGRPTKPPPNGYSLYCAELMVNMKDVPSTERMVLCSKQWKMMTQKEKDMFQKRCEQKKKQYEVDLQRFLESLPEEERERVLMEEKLGGTKLGVATASTDLRAKSPPGKKKSRLPETPKTAEEMWQQSVIGDYLANDRKKAQGAMEAAWKAMEKKEKIPWIKKAAEDQKRYERELLESRPPPTVQGQRKPKFDGEPKKPPVSGYQMFSQELLTNGELNHFSLKERMVEIGKRWHKLSQAQKDKYKKQVEEHQLEYKVELDSWVKVGPPRAGSAPPRPAISQRPGRLQQDTSDSDEEDEKTDSSDSEEDDESSGSTDSEEDDEDDDDDDEVKITYNRQKSTMTDLKNNKIESVIIVRLFRDLFFIWQNDDEDDDDDEEDQSDGSSSSSSEDSSESDSE
uniref:HMG box domain-containing protein n=1 Tax=Denticeps clupeoides TaxID=299321 RepID=A0AAY4DZW8_9TELE